jgi:hypothetical protein
MTYTYLAAIMYHKVLLLLIYKSYLDSDGEVNFALDAEARGPDVLLNVLHPLYPPPPQGPLLACIAE